MHVILKDNVDKLGQTGDMVKVSEGYARNFLLPRNLCVIADESNQKAFEHHKKILEKKRLAQQSNFEKMAQKLSGVTVTISRKAGDTDKLFGSVSNADIATELKKAGFDIDKRSIEVAEPIKALGEYTVTVKLHTEVTANVKVIITKQAA